LGHRVPAGGKKGGTKKQKTYIGGPIRVKLKKRSWGNVQLKKKEKKRGKGGNIGAEGGTSPRNGKRALLSNQRNWGVVRSMRWGGTAIKKIVRPN